MSVLVSDRTESKFEAITYSIELHDMLIDFMQHGFGVKSVDDYVRLRYAYGKDDRENFSKYRFMMQNFKNRVDQLAALIQLYEELFNKKISVISRKLIVSDASSLAA